MRARSRANDFLFCAGPGAGCAAFSFSISCLAAWSSSSALCALARASARSDRWLASSALRLSTVASTPLLPASSLAISSRAAKSSAPSLFCLAAPRVTSATRVPNPRVETVSPYELISGAMCMNIIVLACPPRLSCRSCVSLLFLYGTWDEPLASAFITSPRALRLLLMCWASFSRSPAASDLRTRSLPARSIRFRQACECAPVTELRPSTMTVRTWWLRLDRSFILVSPTARFRAPRAMTSSTSSVHETSTCMASGTLFPLRSVIRISSRLSFLETLPSTSRSRSVSLYISSI
mmetsp:Transcript_5284/g.12875  ORF Transcript_5284/g.12875 Transcript_5284/m.12875 type:complete len:294 (-) Transcript_5284:1860-2741(-)